MSDPILSTQSGGVLTLTLNRPDRLNAANTELIQTLTRQIEGAASDDSVRVLVITGAGRAFCAGQDLTEAGATQHGYAAHLERTYIPLIRAIRSLEKPVITAVNGVAAGAGASLALAGDIRLWSSAASLTLAFSSIALIPDAGATWLLPRLVGYNRAFELMALAERLGAEEALRLGLAERVFPAEQFGAEVAAYADRLAARPVRALGLTKRLLKAALEGSLEDSLKLEAQAQDEAGRGAEHAEGLRAFLEKRAADFLGVK